VRTRLKCEDGKRVKEPNHRSSKPFDTVGNTQRDERTMLTGGDTTNCSEPRIGFEGDKDESKAGVERKRFNRSRQANSWMEGAVRPDREIEPGDLKKSPFDTE
jgi:hypothetical protein